MIKGFFWVWNFWLWDFLGGKIWQVFFGWLDLSRDILDIQTIPRFMMVPTYLRNLWGLEIRRGIFLRFIFGPGIFGGFDICSHLIIPAAWNPKYPLCYCSLRCFALLSFFFLLPGCEWNWKGRGTSCIRRECAKVSSVWYYYNKYYLWIISIELLRQSVSTFCLQSNLMFILICLSELCNYINLMKSKFVCSLFKMTD